MGQVGVSVSLPVNLLRMLEEEAERRGVSRSAVVKEALLIYFSEKKKVEKGTPEEGGPEGFPTRGDPQIEEIGVSKKTAETNKDDVSWLRQFDDKWLMGLYERTRDPILKAQVEEILREHGALGQ